MENHDKNFAFFGYPVIKLPLLSSLKPLEVAVGSGSAVRPATGTVVDWLLQGVIFASLFLEDCEVAHESMNWEPL